MITQEQAIQEQIKTEKRQNVLPCKKEQCQHPPYFRRHASEHVI